MRKIAKDWLPETLVLVIISLMVVMFSPTFTQKVIVPVNNFIETSTGN